MPLSSLRTSLLALTVIASLATAALGHPEHGRLLVCGWNSSNVVSYDAESGLFDDVLVAAGSGGLGLAHSVRFGPDGMLYVTSVQSNRVLRYDPDDGAFLGVFVNPTGTPLSSPTDAIFGPDGHLYVASFNTGQVLRFDGASGAFIDVFATGSGAGRVEMLEWGPDGNLYIATGAGNSVQRFNGATGAFIDTFVGVGSGGLNDPHALTFGPDGDLYVASFNLPRVIKYDGASGALIDAIFIGDDPATGIDESGGLNNPHGIAFGPDGNIYVGSFGNHRVLRYDAATGDFISVFATGGGLLQPTHLVFEPDPCPADFVDDDIIDFSDLSLLLGLWGDCPAPCIADLANNDEKVDFSDLSILLGLWGACP